MEVIFEKLLDQLNSSVFILLAIVVAMGWVLYKVGTWAEKFVHQEQRIGGLEKLSHEVIKIGTKVDLIYAYTNPNATVRSHSPISLTDSGMQIAAKISAETILSKCLAQLKREVENTRPKNAYDIQVASMAVAREKMLSCLDDKEINIIKDEAYTRGLLVEDIFSIFGVLLRNAILKEKSIPVAEVDIHTPQSPAKTA
jgi:hypothetical protein